jgi:hypothetical protein
MKLALGRNPGAAIALLSVGQIPIYEKPLMNFL